MDTMIASNCAEEATDHDAEALPSHADWTRFDIEVQVPVRDEPQSQWLTDLLALDDEDALLDFDESDFDSAGTGPSAPTSADAIEPSQAPRLRVEIIDSPDGGELQLTTRGLTHVDIYLDDEPLGTILVDDEEPASEPFVGVPAGSTLELWGFADDDLLTSRRLTV